jgi:hypothetical protein
MTVGGERQEEFLEDLSSNPDAHRGHELPVDPPQAESADKSDALQTLCDFERVIGERTSAWSARVFSAAFPRGPGWVRVAGSRKSCSRSS